MKKLNAWSRDSPNCVSFEITKLWVFSQVLLGHKIKSHSELWLNSIRGTLVVNHCAVCCTIPQSPPKKSPFSSSKHAYHRYTHCAAALLIYGHFFLPPLAGKASIAAQYPKCLRSCDPKVDGAKNCGGCSVKSRGKGKRKEKVVPVGWAHFREGGEGRGFPCVCQWIAGVALLEYRGVQL